jgi:hypothetical protein
LVYDQEATKEAIALIRNEFGLVNMDILWSGPLSLFL